MSETRVARAFMFLLFVPSTTLGKAGGDVATDIVMRFGIDSERVNRVNSLGEDNGCEIKKRSGEK